jgi:hypothetical protein
MIEYDEFGAVSVMGIGTGNEVLGENLPQCHFLFCGSTALCWALDDFQFLDLIQGRQVSLGGGSARRKAST